MYTHTHTHTDRQTDTHTLHVADVGLLALLLLLALLVDLGAKPLDLLAQLGNDVGVLGQVIGHVEQVPLHLVKHTGQTRTRWHPESGQRQRQRRFTEPGMSTH